MTVTKQYAHVYLSPHLDDAVFSCGGRIWRQRQAGEPVLVVTVFAGVREPDAALSPYARQLHQRWGHPAAVEERRGEDRGAMALLGAEGVHWPYIDCIYRRTCNGRFLYASEQTLWGEIDPTDQKLIAELADRMAGLPLAPEGTLCVPLGVGHHVDHRIVRRAAEGSGYTLIYCEDFPYAEDREAVEGALADGEWREERVLLSQRALDAKIAAAACYDSQVSTFWTDVGDMAASMREFAERTGGGRPAERYWVPVL